MPVADSLHKTYYSDESFLLSHLATFSNLYVNNGHCFYSWDGCLEHVKKGRSKELTELVMSMLNSLVDGKALDKVSWARRSNKADDME